MKGQKSWEKHRKGNPGKKQDKGKDDRLEILEEKYMEKERDERFEILEKYMEREGEEAGEAGNLLEK